MDQQDIYYSAVKSKDARFDGLFFTAVKSTGIYCRPICPARTPKLSGCAFYRYAIEAEAAGFRACFRCRPELAPGQASVDANDRLVRGAVAKISAGYLNGGTVDKLAESFDVTARHLRRTMKEALGVTPVALAQSKRLAMAKQLLQETSLSMTDVAFASGFSSVRRFNAAFQDRFGGAPSILRKETKRHVNNEKNKKRPSKTNPPNDTNTLDDAIVLRLDYRPPLDWAQMLSYFQRRAMVGIEHVEGDAYLRTAQWGEKTGWVRVTQAPKRASLQVQLSLSLLEGVIPLVARLRHKFDLDAHPEQLGEHLAKDPYLAPLVAARPGIRAPGSFDPFAQMVRVILGQHITVKAATTVCNRLIEALGPAIETPFGPLYTSFPSHAVLASCPLETIIAQGIPTTRAQAIQALAQAIVSEEISLTDLTDRETIGAQLLAIRGIGPWTVSTIAMRVLGDPDAFPAGDLELRKAFGGCSARELEQHAEAWRPWRTYAAMHLWKQSPVS